MFVVADGAVFDQSELYSHKNKSTFETFCPAVRTFLDGTETNYWIGKKNFQRDDCAHVYSDGYNAGLMSSVFCF